MGNEPTDGSRGHRDDDKNKQAKDQQPEGSAGVAGDPTKTPGEADANSQQKTTAESSDNEKQLDDTGKTPRQAAGNQPGKRNRRRRGGGRPRYQKPHQGRRSDGHKNDEPQQVALEGGGQPEEAAAKHPVSRDPENIKENITGENKDKGFEDESLEGRDSHNKNFENKDFQNKEVLHKDSEKQEIQHKDSERQEHWPQSEKQEVQHIDSEKQEHWPQSEKQEVQHKDSERQEHWPQSEKQEVQHKDSERQEHWPQSEKQEIRPQETQRQEISLRELASKELEDKTFDSKRVEEKDSQNLQQNLQDKPLSSAGEHFVERAVEATIASKEDVSVEFSAGHSPRQDDKKSSDKIFPIDPADPATRSDVEKPVLKDSVKGFVKGFVKDSEKDSVKDFDKDVEKNAVQDAATSPVNEPTKDGKKDVAKKDEDVAKKDVVGDEVKETVAADTKSAVDADDVAPTAVAKEDAEHDKNPIHTPRRKVLANALRMLAVDAVQQAASGHPGMPMGMADIAEVLWRDYLRHNPADPKWSNRDRFVISNGHGSMLLYALLYLTGYDISIDDLKNFRRLHSKTPGHPEVNVTPGVETTTGPLGQGLANAVGMAIAEARQAAHFNRPRQALVDHYTYVFVGDGCLMEGVSHEACSLAGNLGLSKLIVFWDDNGISIDGDVKGWFSENVAMRFRAYGWQVIPAVDGHHSQAIRAAIDAAQADHHRPTLICCKTQIGHGSPNQACSALVHGNPLGEEEVAAVREELKWPHAPFDIPEDVLMAWRSSGEHGTRLQRVWQFTWDQYQQHHMEAAAQWQRCQKQQLPAAWGSRQDELLQRTQQESPDVATRQASLQWLEDSASMLPEFIGGAADVSESVKTKWESARVFCKEQRDGNYIHYGVREFAMAAIANGLALYGGLLPFVGTYLVFSDYCRSAIRMAALMKAQSIFVFSHDSLALGEDGPTHQAVEQLSSLRLIPGLDVWRPADAAETMAAWRMAVERVDSPSALVLTRQKLQHMSRNDQQLQNISRGGYVIFEASGDCDAIIISTGSEVQLAVAAAKQIEQMGYGLRVISMPCCERFMQQDAAYQREVLAPEIALRFAVEMGVSDYWYRFVGARGHVFSVDRFGLSAPGKDVMQEFGFTAEHVAGEILKEIRIASSK